MEHITIEQAVNGVILSAGETRKVYVMEPGARSRSVHDLLKEVAAALGEGLEVRIDVRDPAGQETPVRETPQKRSLTQEDVASEYGLPVKTLEDWRSSGRGPRYTKPGKRVYYLREDIEFFLRANAVVTTGRG